MKVKIKARASGGEPLSEEDKKALDATCKVAELLLKEVLRHVGEAADWDGERIGGTPDQMIEHICGAMMEEAETIVRAKLNGGDYDGFEAGALAAIERLTRTACEFGGLPPPCFRELHGDDGFTIH